MMHEPFYDDDEFNPADSWPFDPAMFYYGQPIPPLEPAPPVPPRLAADHFAHTLASLPWRTLPYEPQVHRCERCGEFVPPRPVVWWESGSARIAAHNEDAIIVVLFCGMDCYWRFMEALA